MRRVLGVAAAGALAAGLFAATPVEAKPARFAHLDPGGQPSLTEKVPVNIVLIGYDRADVNLRAMKGGLASSYEPIVRSRAPYGIVEPLGIDYTYKYKVKFAKKRYENRFFGTLKRLSQPGEITGFQQAYNDQVNNVLDVTDTTYIDAPSVERWLAFNPPKRVNTKRNTVYLINWYDRPDFEFHVYNKTDEPDPDTGYNFGIERPSRQITAWGGTTARDEENGLGRTRRVWFHDLSAGPESFAGSFNVDDADLDGDGVPDYRIPPAWEYGAYRPASALSTDLAKVVRYVALDALATTSPLYPVELPTAEIPDDIDIDLNTYEGWDGVNASEELVDQPLIRDELGELLWRKDLTSDNQDFPFAGEARRCFLAQWVDDESCYPATGYPGFANLFLQNQRQLARTKDDGDSVDYELPIFNYATGEDYPTPLGYADDNYTDGTQSFVFNFVSPLIVELGYGLTTTTIHEVGHHVGLSHPHDGYDSESGVDFGASGDFYFASLGDYSNSMMSYIDLNWDFSQFDRDNWNRFQAAAYIEGANRLAGEALDAARPGAARSELRKADRNVGAAERYFAKHLYRQANKYADFAYRWAARGAEDAGVDVAAVETEARLRAQVSRQAAEIHEPGEFIDSLDGPRGE